MLTSAFRILSVVTLGFLGGFPRVTRREVLGAIPDLRIAPRSEYRAVVCESQLDGGAP